MGQSQRPCFTFNVAPFAFVSPWGSCTFIFDLSSPKFKSGNGKADFLLRFHVLTTLMGRPFPSFVESVV